MEATLNADHTDELFDKMSNLIGEAILRFTENGLQVTTADPAVVSMIHLEVPADSFENYEVEVDEEEYEHLMEEGEEGILVGVDLENLATVVSLFDEEITFQIQESDLVMTEGSDRFELPILNLSTDDIPSMEELDNFKVEGTLENTQFKTLRTKLAIASDSTEMTLNSDGELMVEGGGDQINVETSFTLSDVEVFEDEEGEEFDEAHSMFALDYLEKAQKMFDNLESCEDTRVKMGDDFPMRIEHESDRENLTFVLAPRIEEQ